MSFLRNPEIKKSIKLYIFLSLLLTVTGFLFGLKIGITVFLLSLLYTLIHFLTTYKRYKKIAGLSGEINKILHGKESIDLGDYSEGELSILQSEILKLTVQLREQAYALKKDKVYLANSIADISHQIKTPLTSVNIILSLISKSDLPEDRRKNLLNEMETLLGNIDWLIMTLLKISKLDAGTIKLKKDTVFITELVKLAVAPIAISLELREQELYTKMEGNETFKGDLSWTVEAVENILKNCMEHTPKGGKITIAALENTLYTELVISDNGSGFDRDDLPYLFERFYKGKNSSDQSIGIGLALARTIIVSQNGTVKAENNIDGGAKFTIRFYKGIV